MFFFTGCQGPFESNWPLNQPWIALVQRGDCTFNQKIQNALDLKASGILIYDLPDGGGVLQSMKVEASPMPSVFTYHWKGMEIAKLVQEHQSVTLAVKKGSHCTSAAKNGANPSKNPSQVIYCTPEDTWEQFQNLLTKQSPFWNWNVTAINNYDFNDEKTEKLFGFNVPEKFFFPEEQERNRKKLREVCERQTPVLRDVYLPSGGDQHHFVHGA